MNILWHIPLFIFVWLPIILYCWAKYNINYWKRRNIPYVRGVPFLGNLKEIIICKKSTADHIASIYFDARVRDAPIAGFHFFFKPALIIQDPELIKRILVKDFNYFPNRHTSSDESSDILGSSNLFLARDQFWRQMRARLTPIFSSGKMKQMFYIVNGIGIELNKYLTGLQLNELTNSVTIETRDLCARFTTDVIASCAYGVKAHSISDPYSDFRQNGQRVFDFNFLRALEFMCFFYLPEFVVLFKFKFFSKEVANFLRTTIIDVMAKRERSGGIKNDLIDTLIMLKNQDKDKIPTKGEVVFQGDAIVAQAAIFFTAGFETTSSLMSFALYELSWKPEMQKRLRQEIKDALQKSNGQLTYDNVHALEYMHMIACEIIRLYPPLPFLDRQCQIPPNEKGYSLDPYNNFLIPHGMPILIPVFAMHRDPKYFPNPSRFDPERFSEENKKNIIPYSYLPFGSGPHNCIGERFGLLQAKIGLINILKDFYVTPSESTPKIMLLKKTALLIQPEEGINLNYNRDALL